MKNTVYTLITSLLLAAPTFAGDRKFAYTRETLTTPPGHFEFEQFITWKAYRSGANKDRFDFRHEIEFGVTEKLQLGVYLSDWRVEHTDSRTTADWRNVAVEAIYNLSNPNTDWLGSALYGEVKLGDELFVLEGKLLLQKNIGPWILAYNAIVEAEWEGRGYHEQVGVLEQTLGVAYNFTPTFSLGAELLHEIEFEDWSEAGEHVLYVGPNASWRKGNTFVAGTVLFQATDLDGEPDVQTRLILGWHF
jgi:hypothetical protein